jgi:hypothetical protein
MLVAGAISGLALLFTGCAENTPEEQREETNEKLDKISETADNANAADTRAEWEAERNEMLTELRQLRHDIEDQLGKTNEKLARKDLKPSERTDTEALKAELEREKAKMDRLITDIENANETNWATIKLDTRKGADDVRTWWQRFKENVDRGTKADADKDGH